MARLLLRSAWLKFTGFGEELPLNFSSPNRILIGIFSSNSESTLS